MKIKLMCIALLVISLSSACSSPAQPGAQTVEVTRLVTVEVPATVIVKETLVSIQTLVVTATPAPPSETPTILPFQKWTAVQVAEAFAKAGLEVGQPTAMTKADLGIAPYLTDDMIHFLIPSLCPDCGGRIFNLKNQADADTLKGYYDKLGKSSAALFSWTFAKDNIVIQLNGDLSEAKAKAYQSALETLGK